MTVSSLYGHVDSVLWIGCLALAGFFLLGMLVQMSRKTFREGLPAFWFLLRVGVIALLLAPLAQLADQSSAAALLIGCAVLAVLPAFQRAVWPAAVWSVLIPGAGLALLSFSLWRAAWLPAAALIGLTVAQRFAYNAGELNAASPFRSQRVAYFQSIALMAVAMLALGHGAAAGFDSEELSVVSDHVSLSVVAFIWLVVLAARHVRSLSLPGTAAPAGAEPELEPGSSWSWLLDPQLRLVAFTGREQELARLTSWAGRRDAMRLALVTGPGGRGLTAGARSGGERDQGKARARRRTRGRPDGPEHRGARRAVVRQEARPAGIEGQAPVAQG